MTDQSKLSKIEWTDHTFNPWVDYPRQLTSDSNWMLPYKWNQDAKSKGTRYRVFCASLPDWLDDEVPIEWLSRLLVVIRDCQNLDWLLLTKRIHLWEPRLRELINAGTDKAASITSQWLEGDLSGLEHIHLGVTCENQKEANERIPLLLQTPAKVRFLSCDPLLEEIDLRQINGNLYQIDALTGQWFPCSRGGGGAVAGGRGNSIDHVIIGGESGAGARPCDIQWIRSLVRQCEATGTAAFVKQLGSNAKVQVHAVNEPLVNWTDFGATGKGDDPNEWPEDLRVRQFPGHLDISFKEFLTLCRKLIDQETEWRKKVDSFQG